MKKYLIIAGLLLTPYFTFAQVPDGVMGFMDGKLYNTSTNALAYICFMDGNCYDKDMKFAFSRGEVAGVSTVSPTPTPTPTPTITPIPTPTTGKLDCTFSIYTTFINTNHTQYLFKCSNTYSGTVTINTFNYKSAADSGASKIDFIKGIQTFDLVTLDAGKSATSTLSVISPLTPETDYKSIFIMDSSNSAIIPLNLNLTIGITQYEMQFEYGNGSYYQGKLIK